MVPARNRLANSRYSIGPPPLLLLLLLSSALAASAPRTARMTASATRNAAMMATPGFQVSGRRCEGGIVRGSGSDGDDGDGWCGEGGAVSWLVMGRRWRVLSVIVVVVFVGGGGVIVVVVVCCCRCCRDVISISSSSPPPRSASGSCSPALLFPQSPTLPGSPATAPTGPCSQRRSYTTAVTPAASISTGKYQSALYSRPAAAPRKTSRRVSLSVMAFWASWTAASAMMPTVAALRPESRA